MNAVKNPTNSGNSYKLIKLRDDKLQFFALKALDASYCMILAK